MGRGVSSVVMSLAGPIGMSDCRRRKRNCRSLFPSVHVIDDPKRQDQETRSFLFSKYLIPQWLLPTMASSSPHRVHSVLRSLLQFHSPSPPMSARLQDLLKITRCMQMARWAIPASGVVSSLSKCLICTPFATSGRPDLHAWARFSPVPPQILPDLRGHRRESLLMTHFDPPGRFFSSGKPSCIK